MTCEEELKYLKAILDDASRCTDYPSEQVYRIKLRVKEIETQLKEVKL